MKTASVSRLTDPSLTFAQFGSSSICCRIRARAAELRVDEAALTKWGVASK